MIIVILGKASPKKEDIYTCIHTYIHTYIHTDIHTYMYIHIYIHIYACDCERVCNMRGVTHATHVATVTAAVRSLQCSDVAARARAHLEL